MAGEPGNILLVRLRLIGDVVFTTPAIRALRRRFPQASLTYLVEPEAEPVVRRNPHLDQVIVASSPRSGGRPIADLRLARELRARRFDLAIDFHGGPRSAWLALSSGAPTRIGYDIPWRRWMYTQRVSRARELRPRHSVVNQWDLLTPVGIGPPDPRVDPTEMPEDPRAVAAVDERLGTLGVEGRSDILILVHVSAGNPFRRWPAASFVELITSLASASPRRRIVLTSGPSEAGAAARIGAEARKRLGEGAGHAVVEGPDLDLSELRALLGRAALFVGGDSGPLHVAGTTEIPIVGVYGPTLPARSAPWRPPGLVSESVEVPALPCRPCDQRRCVPGDFRCLGWLDARTVYEAAERALTRDAQRRGGSSSEV
jgi:ADP-heptose:LPS heptosyltransferase